VPALQSLTDIIQVIARQRGRGDTQPLLLLRQVDGVAGERVSHLPIDGDLAQAWVALTGEPFRPHQAHALAVLRRGESVALSAANADIAMSAYLLLYATLRSQPTATSLVLAPDRIAAQIIRSSLSRINQNLPRGFQLAPAMVDPQLRPDPYARVVIATPETLHGRLLRHHDRAWQLFWSRLRLVMLPDLHRYAGVAGAHLADLLLRLQRIAAFHSAGHVPSTLATLLEIADPEPALASLLGPARVIAGNDIPRSPTTLAVWRAAGRLRESVEIAAAMQRQGYHVHITCAPLDRAQLAPIVADIPGWPISLG
jgi:DEAD/DEAH box helicase domain-containing protein